MKKNILLVLITAIICIIGTASAAYVYTARDINYQPSDENWNVTNASDALSSLKEDLNNVNTNVTEYKQQITEALADKGVEVDENSTMQEITSGITNLKGSSKESRLEFGAANTDYTLTNSGHVSSSSNSVDDTKTRLQTLGSCGPSGVSWMGYVTMESTKSVDLTNYDSIMMSGTGFGSHASSYSNTTYLQIYLKRVSDGEKFYLVNHVGRSQANYTWDHKYIDISNLSGEYILGMYLSDEDGRGPSYIELTSLYLFNLH